MKTNEKKKGISLIVLVITIIVIIILAVVVILTIAKNNPIENAKKARFQNDIKAMQEEVNMYESKAYADASIAGEAYTATTVDGEEMVVKFPSTKGYSTKVKVVDGKLVIIKEALNKSEKIWASELRIPKAVTRTDEGIPVPNGFVASKATGENTKAGGLVIYEGEEEVTDANVEEAKNSRNQYVWVPVEVPEGKTFEEVFIREEGYQNGILQTSFFSNCSEPLNYSGTEASESETAEYNKMKTSVEKYDGFYIARYEASNNGSGIAQSKANKTPWDFIKWGKSMIDLSGGAVEASRKTYPKANATKEGDPVSTLIYGVQWDATVRWLTINYPGIEKDSSVYGNYSNYNESVSADKQVTGAGSKQNTGFSENWKLNNIYDLAGNVWEWTMEASGSGSRVRRGSFFYYTGVKHPVSHRISYDPGNDNFGVVGFRSALYIK